MDVASLKNISPTPLKMPTKYGTLLIINVVKTNLSKTKFNPPSKSQSLDILYDIHPFQASLAIWTMTLQYLRSAMPITFLQHFYNKS